MPALWISRGSCDRWCGWRGKRHVGVIDIGKTNAKVALVELEELREAGVLTTPNRVVRDGLYPHYDMERIWEFVLDGLAELEPGGSRIEALVVATHGASGVLLDAAGGLAFPVLDYEHPGPDDLAAEYDAVRPGFARDRVAAAAPGDEPRGAGVLAARDVSGAGGAGGRGS